MTRALLLAIAGINLLASPATSQGLHTQVLDRDQVLPSGDTVRWIERFLPNAGGAGWAAMLTVDPGARREIWADFVDSGSSVPQRLFSLPLGSNTVVQNVWLQDVREGSVMWEMAQGTSTQITERGVWIDGSWVPEAQGPGPLPNTSWFDVPTLSWTTDGELIAFGELISPSSGISTLVIELGTSTPLIQDGDFIDGTSVRLFLNSVIPGRVHVSPDGRHVIAAVSGTDSRDWLVMDRVPLELHGQTLTRFNAVPQEVLDHLGINNGAFNRFRSVQVENSGEWSAIASVRHSFNQYSDIAIRNGRLIDTGAETNFSVAIIKDSTVVIDSSTQLFTDHAVLAGSSDPVDLDRDGLANPGWSISLIGSPFRANGAGEVYASAYLESTGGASRSGFVRIPRRLPHVAVCAGVPNSSALVGHLIAVGSSSATANDLTLEAHGLPTNAAGYMLVSTERSLPMTPSGSQGNLCLTGAIGRYTGSVIQSGPLGVGPTSIDFASIPQPTGPAVGTAGQTWFFQLWHRDQVAGAATSNFTDAIAVLVQ